MKEIFNRIVKGVQVWGTRIFLTAFCGVIVIVFWTAIFEFYYFLERYISFLPEFDFPTLFSVEKQSVSLE